MRRKTQFKLQFGEGLGSEGGQEYDILIHPQELVSFCLCCIIVVALC